MANRYRDNIVDHLTVKSVDNNNTNSDNIETSTTQYHPNTSNSIPHGQFYVVGHGTKQGTTYHMNVVNENCVYEPTGYSKKILDFKTQPCNSELLTEREIVDYDRSTNLRPESLDLVNLPRSDSSSQSESNNSLEDGRQPRVKYEYKLDNRYVGGQDTVTPDALSGSSAESKPLIYDYSSLDFGVEDPIWSVESERRYRSSGYLEPISERLSSSYNSSRSFSPRSEVDIQQDASVVSEQTKPYIDMTNRVRESAGTPSSFNVFDNNKSRLISPTSRQNSFSKSQPNSPMVYNMPPRAFSTRDSIASDRSSRLDPHTYQSYAAGILYSTGKSEQFLKLQKHFAVLERISDIEVRTKDPKFGTLPRSRIKTSNVDSVDSQYDFDKDDELGYLYAELEEAQKKREFLYSVSDRTSVQWTPAKDSGLLKKEKSLGDLRSSYLNQDTNYHPKPAFTLENEDEFRREQEFLDLYDKYKYSELIEEDLNLPYQDFQNNSSKRHESFLHNDPVTAYDHVASVDSVKQLSKSEPNIDQIHFNRVTSPVKENSYPKNGNPIRSESSKQSYFGVAKKDNSFIKVEPKSSQETISKPTRDTPVAVDEPVVQPLTYTGSRINWTKLETTNLFSEDKPHPDNSYDFSPVNSLAKTTRLTENTPKSNTRSEVSSNKTVSSIFAVKDLRGLAENNEFSLSKFGQMKRSKSCQDIKPADKKVRKHKDPVPLPVSRSSASHKERPHSPISTHNLQISDPDYVFKYRDMGNAGASQEKVTEIKKMAFPEKLELMQKLNDEKNRELENSIFVSSASSNHLESADDLLPWQQRTYESYKTHSLPNRKRQVSGNSIFHKQAPRPFKASNDDDISEHPPAYSSIMTPRSKSPLITSPAISNQVPFASKSHHDMTYTDNSNSGGNLRRWQPQNLADLNSSISSNFVNSSTETFIVNSDEDLSASQTSSLVNKRRDNYQTNASMEKSRSEPDLVIPDYGPSRPRSAKSQINLNQEDKKPHWRRAIGVEYVNEPIEGQMPRTLSGDFDEVRRKWEDGKWNGFGRSQSSESPTSLDNYQPNDSGRIETENFRNTKNNSANNGSLYEDTKRSMIIKTPSNYNYEPYLPPSDIVNEVTKVTEGRKLNQPKSKTRTPSSVSRMTLEYFDQLGGEWKYGTKHNLNSKRETSYVENFDPVLSEKAIQSSNTHEIYSRNHMIPIVSSQVANTNASNPPQNVFDNSQYNSLPNPKRYEQKEKPVPSKRSGKPVPNHQYINGNITDQDKLLHTTTSMPKPILRNPIKNYNGNPVINGSSSDVVPSPPPRSAKSSPKQFPNTASLSRIPPPPARKVPPAPRSTTPTSHTSHRSDHHHRHHQHQATNLPTANPTEWMPAHLKQDDQSQSGSPHAQNTNMSNVDTHSDRNLTRHVPVTTSNSLPISPRSDITNSPSGTQQSPTIKTSKLRMPRSNLTAAEQLGVKSPPVVNTNENGAFKHQTSDVKRLVPMSEKEKRRKEEERIYRKQRLEQLYEEERRRKVLQEEQNNESRRHNDFFSPSMKSPISNDRFNDTNGTLGVQTLSPNSMPINHSSNMSTLSVPSDRRRGFKIQGKAKGLYNFSAQNPRELPFRKGDIIYLLRQIDKNWFEGERYGRVGIFPVNYVEVMTSIEAAQAAAVQAEGQGRVKFNFTAQSPVELSLRKGEYVTLLRSVDDNWFEGRSGNKQGIFPSAYIEIINEPSTPLITPAPSVICTPMTGRGTPEMLSPSGYDAPTPPPQPSPSAFNQPRFPPSQQQFNYRQHPQQQQSPGALRSQSNPLSPVINQELEQRVFSQKSQLSPTQGKKQVTINTSVLHHDDKPSANRGYGVKSKVADDDLAINRYRAVYAYKPQNEDELELQEGDEVYVMEKCDDGWFVGTSGRSGNFGTFPGNYVQLICKFVNITIFTCIMALEQSKLDTTGLGFTAGKGGDSTLIKGTDMEII